MSEAMIIDSTTYVQTAVDLSQGKLAVKSLSSEQVAAYKHAGRLAESAMQNLAESVGDDAIDVVVVQKTMRAFGLVEGRRAVDFFPGNRVASWRNEKMVGTVSGVSPAANMVEVSWDGPVERRELVVAESIVRRGASDELPSGSVVVSEGGIVDHGGRKFAISDRVFARCLSGKRAKVVSGSSSLFVVAETSDGITCAVSLLPAEDAPRRSSVEVIKESVEAIQEAIAQPAAEEKVEENIDDLRREVAESIMSSDGDPSDVIMVAEAAVKLVVPCEGERDWFAIVEAAVVEVAGTLGRTPAVDAKAAASKISPRKREPKVNFGSLLPARIKGHADTEVKPGKVNLSRVADMIEKIQRTVSAVTSASASDTTSGYRAVGRALAAVFRAMTAASDEPWIPFKVVDAASESCYVDVRGDLLAESSDALKPGRRASFKMTNPAATPDDSKTADGDGAKEMSDLNRHLVSCRQSLQMLAKEPNSTQVGRRTAKVFLDLVSFVSDHHGRPWSVVSAS